MSAPVFTRVVAPTEAGATLAELLADALPAVPTAELRRALADGQVGVDGAPAPAERPLAAGEQVEVHGPLGAVRPARLAGLEVLHRGEAVWVVAKPAGVLSQPARGEDPCDDPLRAGLLHALGLRADAALTAPAPRPRVAHRLDRDTSGALAIALSRPALRALTDAFAARQVAKEYLALVRGAPRQAEGVVDLALRLPAPGTRARRVEPVPAGAEGARPARTRWALAERLGRYSLLRAWPETGRQHQVRVHLAALGLPLVADPLYGDGAPLLLSSVKRGYRPGKRPERPLIARAALHAARLTFDLGPALPEEPAVDAEAPLPADLALALKQLRKFG